MPSLVILGSQWGDEGKGKIVDLLSDEADIVARYQGGNNAGHTVVDGDKQYILHLLPSGILKPGRQCLIGNGVVVDPEALLKEIREVEAQGMEVRSRLFLSAGAHLVLPYHRLLDAAQEKLRGKGKIGTTGRGIGCAYGDKVTRVGLRLGDLLNESRLRRKAVALADFYRPIFEKVFEMQAPSAEEVTAGLLEIVPELAPMVIDGVVWLNQRLAEEKKVLIEGAQGILLDIDHGTYPYVTSSNPSPGGVATGLGIPPRAIGPVAGVVKAYTTRVGEGPMPTEFHDHFAELIREEGGEYGATTGRPRRCGWLDVVALRRSAMIAGLDQMLLTKLDVLDKLETIKIGVAYRIDGQETDIFPAELDMETEVEVVYEELPGWQCPSSGCRRYEDLPENARRYIERIEQLVGVPATIVSVSADRAGTIRRRPQGFFA